jgi:hypothetical protein
LRLAGRLVRDKLTKLLWREQWFIGYRVRKPPADGFDTPDLSPYRFKSLLPPRDRFWADPFPVRANDRYYIFFEEWIYGQPRGHISVLEVDEQGRVGEPVPVLQRDYHLSYPFLFEWEGIQYLVPETGENRTVELYRAVSFPDKWDLAGVLLSGVMASDATIVQIEDLWWMFVAIGQQCVATNDELYLFWAVSPLGPWQPHSRNPIKSDVRSARPAGRVFVHEGKFYRPSQDCSTSYGHAIVLNHIEVINPDHYREIEVGRIYPTWLPRLMGTHTINAGAGLTVIDACRKRPRLFA